jgi:hypothetical protein
MGMIARVEAELKNAENELEFWYEILQAVEELLDVYHPDWTRAMGEVNYWEAQCWDIEQDLSDVRKHINEYSNGVETEVAWCPRSGTIESCTNCGMEDHTGDISWNLHVCGKEAGYPKFNIMFDENGDIPF